MNIFKKVGMFFALVLATLVGYAQSAKAAADADLTSALASTTAVISDNKSTIIGFFVGLFALIIVFLLVRKGLGMAKGQIAGAMGGGKRRRR